MWNLTKQADESGAMFGAQQLTWLFSTSFRRNAAAVQQTVEFLSSNPHPVQPAASHVVPLERPDDFNRLVVEFLATCAVGDDVAHAIAH